MTRPQWMMDAERAAKQAAAQVWAARAEGYEAEARSHEARALICRAQANEARVQADVNETASRYPSDLEPPRFILPGE